MLVTNEVFLWVNGILIASILAFIASLWKIRGEISPLCDIARRIQVQAIDSWLKKRGMEFNQSGKGKQKESNDNHKSLSAHEEAERDTLIARGKASGLTQTEATRLRELLEKDARNDTANGIFTFLALAALIALIAAFVNSITRRQ